MFQKSLTLSLLANLSIGAALSGGVVKAEVQPQGQIEFTADNASEVFLNGTSPDYDIVYEWYVRVSDGLGKMSEPMMIECRTPDENGEGEP